MKYIAIDVETNGLPDYKKPADDPCQPRIASLGLILLDEKLEPEAEFDLLIKPDGWVMTPEAAAVNGLTDEILNEKGVPIAFALNLYAEAIKEGRAVAAFGAQHDCKVLRGEFRRANQPDLFEITLNVCLMRACPPLKIAKSNGKGGWPRLEDACRHFKIEPEPTPHQAIEGARRSAQILRHLCALKALPEPSVHLAKDKAS